MRYLIPFIVLLFFIATSCGYQQIRFTKVAKLERVQTSITDSKVKPTKNQIRTDAITSELELENEVVSGNEIIEDQPTILEVQLVEKAAIPTDTLDAQSDLPEDVVYLAKKAANRASTAKALFITSSIFLFILPFFAFIFTFIGLWFYIKSNRSRFITEAGEAHLRKAKIALIVNIALFFLLTVLLIGLIFLVF